MFVAPHLRAYLGEVEYHLTVPNNEWWDKAVIQACSQELRPLTGNLRAVQILLGHNKIENTVRYLGIDVENVLALAENTEI
ncbi:MAG: hypothetical protein ABS88_01130 [Sphingopyxis sp. SCN 67-31]|nr:MAG: hypothetical protein ABS88_01130 [Sphingopyxis sp. SCN 67-31]